MADQIKVFQQESELGLADLVRASGTVLTASVARPATMTSLPEWLRERLAAGREPCPPCPSCSSANTHHVRAVGANAQCGDCGGKFTDPEYGRSKAADLSLDDLFPLESVLVSTGLNLNDDWFDPAETYAARHTPEDKPLNHLHEAIQVVGHMTASRVVDGDLRVVAEGGEVPASFHVVNSAVLYRHWPGYPDRQAMVDKIIAELQTPPDEAWCVSMECRFRGFDYVLIPYDGTALATAEARVVTRSDETAYLTKHLRAYGGTGKFQSYKVGRVLRNITFSGVGLVRQPANPASVVLSAGSANAAEKNSDSPGVPGYEPDSRASGANNDENSMTIETLTTQVADLTAKLAEANKRLTEADQAKAAETAKTVADLAAELAAARAELAKTAGEFEALKVTAAEADKVIKSLTARAETAEAALAAEAEKARAAAAAAALALRVGKVKDTYGLGTDEEAAAAARPLEALSDEAFDAHLATMAAYKTQLKTPSKTEVVAEALNVAEKTQAADATVVVVETDTAAAKHRELETELLSFFGKTK